MEKSILGKRKSCGAGLIFEQMNIFNEVFLNDIFTNEEVEQLLKEPTFNYGKIIYEQQEDNSNLNSTNLTKENFTKKKKLASFDRMSLILKFLQLSIEKLNKYSENTFSKGLEWVRGEIQDSLIFKSDERTLKHLDKLKETNQDIQLVLNWVQEYSTLNNNQKGIINTLKNINDSSLSKKDNTNLLKNSYFSNYLSNEKLEKIQFNTNPELESLINYNSKLNYVSNGTSFLNFSEDCMTTIEEPLFDIFQLEKSIGKENTLSTISCYIFITMGLYSIINYSHFENFLDHITKGYNRKNPYHTDLHAADVEQTCFMFFKYGDLKEVLYLNDLDCAAFLISGIIHDFKHPGLTNNFLINSRNEIAFRYNDNSVLENFHVAEAFKIISQYPESNIFSELTAEEFKVMRKRIVECVLATDMTLHNKEYSYMKLKLETFKISEGKNVHKIFENLDTVGVFNTQQEFLNTLMHTADISNPTKPLHIYKLWADLVMQEFWEQGDKEKELKLPVSFLCDRVTTKVPASQIGFMDGIVLPLVQIVVGFFPGLKFMVENIKINKDYFKKLKEEEDIKNAQMNAQVNGQVNALK